MCRQTGLDTDPPPAVDVHVKSTEKMLARVVRAHSMWCRSASRTHCETLSQVCAAKLNKLPATQQARFSSSSNTQQPDMNVDDGKKTPQDWKKKMLRRALAASAFCAAAGVVGYFGVRAIVRQQTPIEEKELLGVWSWFDESVQKLSPTEWDAVMGSGRILFMLYSSVNRQGDKTINIHNIEEPQQGPHVALLCRQHVALLCRQLHTTPHGLTQLVLRLAKLADRDGNGQIDLKEFLMMWMLVTFVVGSTRTGDQTGLERAIFSMADTDGNGFVNEAELAMWLYTLHTLRLLKQGEEAPHKAWRKTTIFPKSLETHQRIKAAISKSESFMHLNDEQIQDLIDCMQEIKLSPGTILIQQGEEGDYFYVIESGEFDVLQAPKAGMPLEKSKKVYTIKDRGAFGEIAILYDMPRTSTVRAATDATLFRLDKEAFLAFERQGTKVEAVDKNTVQNEELDCKALAKLCMQRWDLDKDGKLSPEEFENIAETLRVSDMVAAAFGDQQERPTLQHGRISV
eukprot:g74666.t1